MRDKWCVLKKIIGLSFVCMILSAIGTASVYAEEDLISETKQGIVEVYSGFYSEDGVFYPMKHASGFLISNGDSQAYIATVYSALKNTEKQKKSYCKKHGISYENNMLNNSIQIVIKGDVMVEASVMTESEKENYSILQVSSSIAEKTPVTFASNKTLMIGDTVYALGFAEDAGEDDDLMNRHTEFSAMDVKVEVGAVQDTGANKEGVLYIQHSALLNKGNTGGVLLNEDGYVVGLNSIMFNEDSAGVYYSLPIDNIRQILDNFQISYQSIDKMDVLQKYTELLEESKQMLEDKRYKESSKENLREVISKAENINLDENTDQEELNVISEQLIKERSLLKLKMKTTRKIVIALGIVIIFLGIWMIKLIAWKLSQRGRDQKRRQETEVFSEQELNKRREEERKEKENTEKIRRQPVSSEREERDFYAGDEGGNSDTIIMGRGVREQNNHFYQREKKAVIKNINTGKVLPLDKPEIYIGRKGDVNDFIVRNNSSVGRRHACIKWEQGSYYLYDLESSNGTYINGANIGVGGKSRLKNKDKFTLADEDFIFCEIWEEDR